jgi:PLP dependent protein
MSINSRILEIKKSIPKKIEIVAATKKHTVNEINEAISATIGIIGENYVSEAESKYLALKGKIKIHLIGHLQTNKVKKAVQLFDMIQSVDSLKLAKEINNECRKIGKIMPILIEVNSGKEQNKSGIFPEDANELIQKISLLSNIKIKGLMTMGPAIDDPEKLRPYFKETKELFEKIKSKHYLNIDMEILSMGMSDSYKIAIEEGSSMIRLGTVLFGE